MKNDTRVDRKGHQNDSHTDLDSVGAYPLYYREIRYVIQDLTGNQNEFGRDFLIVDSNQGVTILGGKHLIGEVTKSALLQIRREEGDEPA